MKQKRDRLPSLWIRATQKGLSEVRLSGKRGAANRPRPYHEVPLARKWSAAARKELKAYFAGRLRFFSTPCDLGGLPPFTQDVLRITAQIPYGEVRSYRWVAHQLGKPKAVRAVGNALARNPVPIIIPCHRVVRSDGRLGGYALGVNWKKRLLDMEEGFLAV